MEGIKNLNKLLKGMNPELIEGEYVFCTLPGKQSEKLKDHAILVYKEKEGVTLILKRKIADDNSLQYSGVWALITLTVHSDLSAVGFLARITQKLAEAGISVNAVSAYYHDHLFVPAEKAGEAVEVLKNISKQ